MMETLGADLAAIGRGSVVIELVPRPIVIVNETHFDGTIGKYREAL